MFHTPSQTSVRATFCSCLWAVGPAIPSDWGGFLPGLSQIPLPPTAHSVLMHSLCSSVSGVIITSTRLVLCSPVCTASHVFVTYDCMATADCKIVVGRIINVSPEFTCNSTAFLPLNRACMNINEQAWYHLITICMPKPYSRPSKAESHGMDTDISIPKAVFCRR